MTTTPIPATMKNKERQPSKSMRAPAAGGPMAGAKLMTRPTRPMTTPRFSFGAMSRISVHTMGMATPVAVACRTRATISSPNVGARAAKTDAPANSTNAPANSLRTENRPSRNAFIGMTIASTMAYTDVSHCTVVSFTSISCIITGSAGARSV